MWQKVAKFKGAEYFRKALYIYPEPTGVSRLFSMLLGRPWP